MVSAWYLDRFIEFISSSPYLVSALFLGDKPRPVRLGIARTNSLETLSSSYMNGQWPKDGASAFVQSTCNKGTQVCHGLILLFFL